MMDMNDATARMTKLWLALGQKFERHARQLCVEPIAAERDLAVEFAKHAEACFFRTTGEMDAFDYAIEKLLQPATQEPQP